MTDQKDGPRRNAVVPSQNRSIDQIGKNVTAPVTRIIKNAGRMIIRVGIGTAETVEKRIPIGSIEIAPTGSNVIVSIINFYIIFPRLRLFII